MNKIKNVTLGATVGFLAGLSSAAVAQDQAGGTLMTLGVSQRLSYTDNPGFTSASSSAFTATTGLSFSLMSATKVDAFGLSLDSGLVFDTDSEEFSIVDPTGSISYQQSAKDSGVQASLSYSQADISESFDIVAGDSTFVVLDEGTRSNLSGSFAYDFGRTDRVSGNVGISHNRVDYTGTTSADLIDQSTTSVTGALNLQVDDRIITTVSGFYTLSENENGLETANLGFGTGVSLAYSKRLSFDVGAQYNRINQTSGGVTLLSQGLGFSGGATYQMPDGAITASFSSAFDEDGRTYSGNIGRQMALKSGDLSFSFGLSGREGGDLNPLYAVSYNQDLPRDASARVQLSQSFATSDSGREAINTSLSAAYDTPLTAVSSIGATLQFRGTQVTNFDNEDVSRFDIGVNYAHELAEDWDVVSGYTYSRSASDADPDAQSNTVYIGLQKDFSWRP